MEDALAMMELAAEVTAALAAAPTAGIRSSAWFISVRFETARSLEEWSGGPVRSRFENTSK
jgi:hypothetical protein